MALSLIKELNSVADFSHHLGVQAEVEKELEKLLKSWICKSKTIAQKVLLYVDDIDRCPAAKMAEIVESLRVVLENEEIRKRLIVVCSIDAEKLKAGIRNKLTTIKSEGKDFEDYVSEQMDKLFIFSIGLCRLSHGQLCQYLDRLVKEDGSANQYADATMQVQDSVVDESRILGSIIAVRNSDSPIEVTESHYMKILKYELSKYDVVTPRKARIIYYRILFANNILHGRNGALFTDSLVRQIVRHSIDKKEKIDIKTAYSDIIEMVVCY